MIDMNPINMNPIKMNKISAFDPLNVSSKFAICGLPIRVDTYKTCSFGCKYCFSNYRVIMNFEKTLQVGNVPSVEKRLAKVFAEGYIPQTFLDTLIKNKLTWHCGGMSDPFQPCELKYKVTEGLVNIANKYGMSILFSTKSDTVYGCNITPELHTFQLSVTNCEDRRDIEPNVPSIQKRLDFYKALKRDGFRVGIRIQPFIPDVSTLEIVKMFEDADNFTIEGLKLVPQNIEHKEMMLKIFNLKKEDFTQMGLLNLLPEIRLRAYKPFLDYFEKKNIPFSISYNDLRRLSTNECCCGDKLVKKASGFDTTAMIMKYGDSYSKSQLDKEISGYEDCVCNSLFTSNRQEGCKTVGEFYAKRFNRKNSPFSPNYQYTPMKQLTPVDGID